LVITNVGDENLFVNKHLKGELEGEICYS